MTQVTGQWRDIIRNAVYENLELVEQTRRYVLDVMFPSLIEPASDDEKRAYFQSLGPEGWDLLLQRSPYMYRKLSQEALNVEQRAHGKETEDGEPAPPGPPAAPY